MRRMPERFVNHSASWPRKAIQSRSSRPSPSDALPLVASAEQRLVTVYDFVHRMREGWRPGWVSVCRDKWLARPHVL